MNDNNTKLNLQDVELNYRFVLESSKEGYFETDINGEFIYVNNKFCEIFDKKRFQITLAN